MRLFFWVKKKKGYKDIDPDEIFLDSRNLPGFDTDQFEGRIEQPISRYTVMTLAIAFLFIGGIFLMKVWDLQVIQGDEFLEVSERNRLDQILIFAKRGVIYDRNGVELASNNIPKNKEDILTRNYLDWVGLAHVIGYVDYPKKDSSGFYFQTETVGKEGVELFYDELLGGENGAKITEEDAFGKVLSESIIRIPEDGRALNLSIDSRIQERLYLFMQELAQDVGFNGGGSVIMDVRNGEILALVSFPEFSSQLLSDGGDTEIIASLVDSPREPFLNRVTTGLYAPGSVIKPFIAAGALDREIIDQDTSIYSSGSIEIQNPYDPALSTIFNDWKAHGWVDLRRALAVSSNVYFFSIGGGYEDQRGIGISGIEKYARTFGIGKVTGIDLPTEAAGNIPNPKWKERVFPEDPIWRVGDTYNTSIGQYGFQVTPLQMARAVGAIANNGLLVEPHVRIDQSSAPVGKVRIDEKDLQIVREGMRLAVLEGTAKGLNVSHVEIAAKTGTAELGVVKDNVNSWVIGFFPYEDPQYAFATVMEKGPARNLIGSLFVMRQLFDWMFWNTPEYFN